MKATDFLEEWNRTHTSSPSLQDALDWAEKEHSIEMKEQSAEWIMTLGVQKQVIINKACEWLDTYLMEIGYPDDWMRDSPNIESGKERFIKAMEEELCQR